MISDEHRRQLDDWGIDRTRLMLAAGQIYSGLMADAAIFIAEHDQQERERFKEDQAKRDRNAAKANKRDNIAAAAAIIAAIAAVVGAVISYLILIQTPR